MREATRTNVIFISHPYSPAMSTLTGQQNLAGLVLLEMSVCIHDTGKLPVVVSGYGINQARFPDLQTVWDTFCVQGLSPIWLDNYGCDRIRDCIIELGFTPT